MDSSESYMELMMTNATLDCEMHSLKSKIQSKNEENIKLENLISEYKKKISDLQKGIKASYEREEKIKNNINSLRNSRYITEELATSMKHELRIIQEKRVETKIARDKIINKYSQIFESYRNVYKSLPWIQKNHELKISTDVGKIQLNILKMEYSSYKKKLSLFHKIGEQRIKVAITNLAKLMVERNNLQVELYKITNQTDATEANIIKLKEEKINILQRIDMKVKGAVAEARERAAKAQTSNYIESPKQLVAPLAFLRSSTPSSKESIFSRLGISGPLSLKRPVPFISTLPEKVHRPMDKPQSLEPLSIFEQKDKEVSRERKDLGNIGLQVTMEKQTERNASLKKREQTMTQKVTSVESSKQINTKNSVEDTENEKIFIEQPSNSLNEAQQMQSPKSLDDTQSISKEQDLAQQTHTKRSSENVDSITEEVENKKKKLKKKTKKQVGAEKPKIVKKSNYSGKKKVSFSIDNDCKKESLGPKEIKPEIPNEQEKVSSVNTTSANDNKSKEEPVNKDKDNNVPVEQNTAADISIDSDSILSTNFSIENRDDLIGRNLESPDFFIQRTQGYCFSPVQTSSPSSDKSGKDKRLSAHNFGSPPDMSPLFGGGDNQKKTSGGTSSFADFFGSSSPKKSDKSTKSFFQLF